MSHKSEIAAIATDVEAVYGRTDEEAGQTRISASERLIAASRGRLTASRGALSQLYQDGTVSAETFEWLRDRFAEEAYRHQG